MNIKTIYSIVCLLLFATVITSCSSSDEENSDSLGSEATGQMSANWYLNDISNASYISKIESACKENSLNYYNYVQSDGTLKGAGTFRAIQMVNGNTLKYWYFQAGVVGCKPSLRSDYYYPTRYYLGKDNVIFYTSSSSMYTYTKIDGKIIVTNGDIYTITSNGLVIDGGSEAMNKQTVYTSDFRQEEQIAKACERKSNVRSEVSYDYDKFTCYVTFKSQLSSLYPNSVFIYGVEYGISNYNDIWENEAKETSFYVNLPIEGWVDNDMFSGSLKALEDKLERGETLTKHERMLYDALMKNREESIDNAKRNFVVRSYVRFGGMKYYLQ